MGINEMSPFEAGKKYHELVSEINSNLSFLFDVKKDHWIYSKYLQQAEEKYKLAIEIAQKHGGEHERDELKSLGDEFKERGSNIKEDSKKLLEVIVS